MMVKRIIAVLTFDNGVLTRTKNFIQDYRYTKNFINNTLFDGIVIIDVSKSKKNRKKFYEVVNNFSKNCFVPICVGGKINSIEEVRTFQKLGVDKILINSLVHTNINVVNEIIKIFGNQFLVVGIDVKRINNKYYCYYNRGQNKIKDSIDKYIELIKKLNPGEILLQSIDLDGSLNGLDISCAKKVRKKLKMPIILCGGAGNWDHFVKAFKFSNIDAVCTNNIYHFTYKSILSAKKHCASKKIKIRMENNEY